MLMRIFGGRRFARARISGSAFWPLLIAALIAAVIGSARAESSCGNGIVEPGEECDYGASNAAECCSAECKNLGNLRKTCQNGLGICQNGQCTSRELQCSRWDANILASGNAQYQGPFKPCTPGQNINNKGEQKCTLACAGNPLESQWQCLDFAQFSNVDSKVGDGLLCGSMGAGDQIGVCMGGLCDKDACRQARCQGRGDCMRGPGGGPGDIVCRCDNPYSGGVCQLSPTCAKQLDACGVCGGTNTTCSVEVRPSPGTQIAAFLNSPLFLTIILPILATIIFISVVILAIYFYYHRRHKQSLHPSLLGTGNTGWIPKQGPPQRFGISVRWEEYRCIQDYEPRMPDELALIAGDILFKLFEYDDGWAKGYNTRTQQEGVYPVSFTEVVTEADTGPSSPTRSVGAASTNNNINPSVPPKNNQPDAALQQAKDQPADQQTPAADNKDESAPTTAAAESHDIPGPFTNYSSL